jgi:hypothetical protein
LFAITSTFWPEPGRNVVEQAVFTAKFALAKPVSTGVTITGKLPIRSGNEGCWRRSGTARKREAEFYDTGVLRRLSPASLRVGSKPNFHRNNDRKLEV